MRGDETWHSEAAPGGGGRARRPEASVCLPAPVDNADEGEHARVTLKRMSFERVPVEMSVSRRARFVRAGWQASVAAGLVLLAVAAFGGRVELLGAAYLALVTPELCRVDIAEHRLPNAIVLPALALATAAPLLGWAVTGAPPTGALVAGAATGAFLVVMHVAGGLGMGDVKLGTALGLSLGCLGPVAALAGPLIGFVAGGVVALAGILAPALGLGRRMPFGPFLLFGFWATLAASAAGLLVE